MLAKLFASSRIDQPDQKESSLQDILDEEKASMSELQALQAELQGIQPPGPLNALEFSVESVDSDIETFSGSTSTSRQVSFMMESMQAKSDKWAARQLRTRIIELEINLQAVDQKLKEKEVELEGALAGTNLSDSRSDGLMCDLSRVTGRLTNQISDVVREKDVAAARAALAEEELGEVKGRMLQLQTDLVQMEISRDLAEAKLSAIGDSLPPHSPLGSLFAPQLPRLAPQPALEKPAPEAAPQPALENPASEASPQPALEEWSMSSLSSPWIPLDEKSTEQAQTTAKPDAKPEAKADAEPESKPQEKTSAAAKAEAKAEAKADAKPKAKPQEKSILATAAKPDAKPDVKPEAKADAKPQVVATLQEQKTPKSSLTSESANPADASQDVRKAPTRATTKPGWASPVFQSAHRDISACLVQPPAPPAVPVLREASPSQPPVLSSNTSTAPTPPLATLLHSRSVDNRAFKALVTETRQSTKQAVQQHASISSIRAPRTTRMLSAGRESSVLPGHRFGSQSRVSTVSLSNSDSKAMVVATPCSSPSRRSPIRASQTQVCRLIVQFSRASLGSSSSAMLSSSVVQSSCATLGRSSSAMHVRSAAHSPPVPAVEAIKVNPRRPSLADRRGMRAGNWSPVLHQSQDISRSPPFQ